MRQTHIEHFRTIDFNGELCPAIDGTAQPKVNYFLAPIFFFFGGKASQSMQLLFCQVGSEGEVRMAGDGEDSG